MHKHFVINSIEKFNNKLALETKEFRVDFDENTYKYFIRLDQDYFRKWGCISDNNKICLNGLYNEKCELNQVIKENTNDEKSKMIPIVVSKYYGYPVYEIPVRWIFSQSHTHILF